MKVKFNPSVNFGAKCISRGSVIYNNPQTKKIEYQPVAFVQYDGENLSDFDALVAVTDMWHNHNIARRISGTAYNIKNRYISSAKVYALTSQTDSFEKLDPDKILGMTAVDENSPFDIYLSDIIVNPDDKTHKKVGTTILNKLKNIYDVIDLNAIAGVDGFYLRNGFKKAYDHRSHYYWKRYPDEYV